MAKDRLGGWFFSGPSAGNEGGGQQRDGFWEGTARATGEVPGSEHGAGVSSRCLTSAQGRAIPRSSFLLAEVPSLALGFLWPRSYVLLLSFDFSPLLSWEEKREEQQRFRAPQTLAWREQCYGWDLPATSPHPGANPPRHLSGHNQPPVPTSHGSRFFHHEAFPGPLHQTICFPSLPVYGNPPAHACPGPGLLGFHT